MFCPILKEMIACAFNEWMRRYTQSPERFSREWQAVGEFLAQEHAGKIPSYGDECAAYLQQILSELQ